MASRKRKAHPQLIAIELMLVAGFAITAYLVAGHLGGHSRIPLFLAGMTVDRALILILRHRNKPVRIQSPLTRKPASRR